MKIISGGQTGADRTGLEIARELGILKPTLELYIELEPKV